MRVMAFSFDEERLRILEHNRRRYPDRISTPVYELCMELIVQDNYIYNQIWEHNLFRMSEGQRAYLAELSLAHAHIQIMHKQATESWEKVYGFEWNIERDVPVAETYARMARKREEAA